MGEPASGTRKGTGLEDDRLGGGWGRRGDPAVGTRKWTRREYDRLVEAEILGPEDRIELLGGQMIVKEPQYSPHATAIQLVERALDRAFGPGWSVRPQLPIALAEDSEPEPDVCVVRGDPREYS